MHELPFWFLLGSLFLPRLCLFIGWSNDWSFPMPQPGGAIFWLLLPRLLTIFMIFGAYGCHGWFWIHTLVAAAVYLFGGGSAVHRDN